MEYILTLHQHVRNRSNQCTVRDAKTLATVHQFPIASLQRPVSFQPLQNKHLVVGFSTARPFHYEFVDETGKTYNKLELDADKCWILKSGLVVEVVGKQTIIKQVMPDFKQPAIVQIYDFAFQWVGQLTDNVLVAQKCDHMSTLCVLELSSPMPKWEIPIFVTNLLLEKCMLFGTTLCGDYIFKICLRNVVEQGTVHTECVPIVLPRRKSNHIKLTYINDQFMLYENDQKQHSVLHIVDWTKHTSIWNAQNITVMTTSDKGWFVYWNRESDMYQLLRCGCSVSKPLTMLVGPPSKSLFATTPSDTLLFYVDKQLQQWDVSTFEKTATQDIARNVVFLTTTLSTYQAPLEPIPEAPPAPEAPIPSPAPVPLVPEVKVEASVVEIVKVPDPVTIVITPSPEPMKDVIVETPIAVAPTVLPGETPTALAPVVPPVALQAHLETPPAGTTCSIM